MEHLLNYKAFNIELFEPHLQEMRRDFLQNKAKQNQQKNKIK